MLSFECSFSFNAIRVDTDSGLLLFIWNLLSRSSRAPMCCSSQWMRVCDFFIHDFYPNCFFCNFFKIKNVACFYFFKLFSYALLACWKGHFRALINHRCFTITFFFIISINIYFPHISWGLGNDFLAHNLFFTFSMYIHFSHTCFYVLK